MNTLAPPYKEIPQEFRDGRTEWNALVNDWFFRGLKELKSQPKADIDRADALGHLRAILASFDLSHEHKEAAVAYLLSLWFENPEWVAM